MKKIFIVSILLILITTSGCIHFEKDSDSDGLKNSQEEKIGSSPNMKDTDQDGLNDSMEYEKGTKIKVTQIMIH